MATFRGIEVGRVEFVRQRDLYLVYSVGEELLGELSSIEFRSLPQLRQVPHGRYRRASSQAQGYPAQPSGRANARTITVPWASFTTITWATIPQPKPRPIENAGIRAGEIRAWRAWRMLGRNRLHSVYIDSHFWPPGRPVTGDVTADYGVHAFKSRAWAENYMFYKRVFEDQIEAVYHRLCGESASPKCYVIGIVDLWGDVIEHERGYRAEFAQITSIEEIIGNSDKSALDQLRADYRVGAAR